MALFRKKVKDAEDEEPTGDAVDQLGRMSIEELLEAAEVQHQQRELETLLGNRGQMITRHLELIHQPGGLDHIKATADFMEFGAARPYLNALSDITFEVDEQLLAGNDIFTVWTVTGTHTAELCGVAPTGAPVTLRGITMSIIKEGVVASEYTYWDFPPLTDRLLPAAPS